MDDKYLELAAAIAKVGEEVTKLYDADPVDDIFDAADLPDDIRYSLLALAGSLNDYIFWVRRKTDDGVYWVATEIETGMHVEGVSAREALENYFKDDMLNYRVPRSESWGDDSPNPTKP